MLEVLTATLVLATIVLAFFTYLMQKEANQTRLENIHGLVVITAEQDEHQHCYLVIKNIGSGPAFNVKLNASPDFIYFNNYKFNSSEFTSIPVLKPEQNVKTIFGNNYKMISDINSIVTCSWINKDKSRSNENCTIRPKIFDHILKAYPKNSVDKISDELKKINSNTKYILKIIEHLNQDKLK